MTKEADILLSCKKQLEYWKSMKVVFHYERLNSGKIYSNGYWIQLASKGTPDLIAYIKRDNLCCIYFIECKRKGGTWHDNQIEFMMKFRDLTNVFYDVVTDSDEINRRIELITNFSNNQLDKVNI